VIGAILDAREHHEAERLRHVGKEYQEKAPRLAEWQEVNGPESLAISSMPVGHWRRLRTSKQRERLNEGTERRTRAQDLFPNEASALRLVVARSPCSARRRWPDTWGSVGCGTSWTRSDGDHTAHTPQRARQGRRAAANQVDQSTPLLPRECVTSDVEEVVAVASDDVGHFDPWRGYDRALPAVSKSSRSSGLIVARTAAGETWVYTAVVRGLECPSRTWMVRRSVPASSKCVAKLCRRV
jgi:hypothetical protein